MSEYPHTDGGLRAALVSLGATDNQVALTLMRGGWHGKRNDCARCPVAAYLAAMFGPHAEIDVGPDSVSVTREIWVPDGYGQGYSEPVCISAWTPRAVQRFLRQFDFTTRYGFLEAA